MCRVWYLVLKRPLTAYFAPRCNLSQGQAQYALNAKERGPPSTVKPTHKQKTPDSFPSEALVIIRRAYTPCRAKSACHERTRGEFTDVCGGLQADHVVGSRLISGVAIGVGDQERLPGVRPGVRREQHGVMRQEVRSVD